MIEHARYVVERFGEHSGMRWQLCYRTEDGWQNGYRSYRQSPDAEFSKERILEGEISLTEPRYRNLVIGDVELRPNTIN